MATEGGPPSLPGGPKRPKPSLVSSAVPEDKPKYSELYSSMSQNKRNELKRLAEVEQNEKDRKAQQAAEREKIVIEASMGVFCVPCGKKFAKQSVYDAHLSGKKHLKALEKMGKTEEAEVCKIDMEAAKRKREAEAEEREEKKAKEHMGVVPEPAENKAKWVERPWIDHRSEDQKKADGDVPNPQVVEEEALKMEVCTRPDAFIRKTEAPPDEEEERKPILPSSYEQKQALHKKLVLRNEGVEFWKSTALDTGYQIAGRKKDEQSWPCGNPRCGHINKRTASKCVKCGALCRFGMRSGNTG